MIASIRGEVISRLGGEVVIEAAGVGYRMAVSTETLTSVPAAGEQARLFTHLVLRDDGMHLFGFASQPERELFLMLIGVQSVGPKVALAVLSGGTPRELLNAIASGDSARFQAVPGIGKRTAERIIVELREKVAGRSPMRSWSATPPPTIRAPWPARACSGWASPSRRPTRCSTRREATPPKS